MNKSLETLRQPRIKVLEDLQNFTLEQLNEVPAGFNNNIMWNLGHMIATQQGSCYARAGLKKVTTDDFFDTFKQGSKPERFYNEADFENIKALFFSTLEQLDKDLQTDMFATYPTWTSLYRVEISNIEEAIKFLPFHDGLHIGYMMSLRKLVKK